MAKVLWLKLSLSVQMNIVVYIAGKELQQFECEQTVCIKALMTQGRIPMGYSVTN